MKKKFRPRDAEFRGEKQKPKADGPKQKTKTDSAIFGVLPVLEVLRHNPHRIDRIVIAEGARMHRLNEIVEIARANALLISKVSRENLVKQLGPDVNHQGVIAYAAAADYVTQDEIIHGARKDALLLILDGVEDPRNLGAILRVAECAGSDGVFIPERRAVGLTETVAKSSAGATEHVKVAKVANINRLIEDLKSRNIWCVGTSADAEMDYTAWDWTQSSALVLGGEGGGLHRLVAETCDVLVKIPMYGKIESLNVSVAAGVILFEAVRQRVSSSRVQFANDEPGT